jgi:hypothetical protein
MLNKFQILREKPKKACSNKTYFKKILKYHKITNFLNIYTNLFVLTLLQSLRRDIKVLRIR